MTEGSDRYEGIVVMAMPGQLDPRSLQKIGQLRALGVHVGVVGTVSEELVDQLAADERSSAVVVFSDEEGVDIVVVDESGSVERTGVPDEAAAALVRAGRAVVERFRGLELDARADFVGAGAVVVELGHVGHWDESSTSTLSSSVLLELAREVAFEAGMEDAHVSLDGHHRLRLALGDHEDATQAILDAFWRRGIVADATLVGSLTSLFDAFDQQIRRRLDGALPQSTYAKRWGLTREGFHAEQDGSAQAVFALSDGVIGSSGAPLGDAPGANRRVLASGVYTGEGPETHLLGGPIAWHLPSTPLEDAALRRVLDLRTGVVHEELTSAGRSYRSVRFSSLARPGTAVLRARRSRRSCPMPFCSRRPRVRPSTVERWTRRTGSGRQVTPAGSSPPAFSNSSDRNSTGVVASTASLPITPTRTTCRTRPPQATAYERRLESGSTACSTSTVARGHVVGTTPTSSSTETTSSRRRRDSRCSI